MEIIPGAAYLSLSETRILYGYAGFSTRGKTVLRDPGTNHILEYDDEIPTDLVLLYAPGDKVTTRGGGATYRVVTIQTHPKNEQENPK